MSCNCEICKAPRRRLSEALHLAEQRVDDATAQLHPGELFDATHLFESAAADAKSDPVLSMALMQVLVERHDLLLPERDERLKSLANLISTYIQTFYLIEDSRFVLKYVKPMVEVKGTKILEELAYTGNYSDVVGLVRAALNAQAPYRLEARRDPESGNLLIDYSMRVPQILIDVKDTLTFKHDPKWSESHYDHAAALETIRNARN